MTEKLRFYDVLKCGAPTGTVAIRRRWTQSAATQHAELTLKNRDVIGHVDQPRGGRGHGEHRPKATNRQGLVVEKVEKMDMKFKPASLYEPPRCDAICEEPQ